mgnify:FL=1
MPLSKEKEAEILIDANNSVMDMASLLCRDFTTVLRTRDLLTRNNQVHHLDEWIELAIRHWIQHCPFAKEISAKYPDLYPCIQIPIASNLDILLRSEI